MDYPLQNVQSLREDSRGFIWAGTSSGVFRLERNRAYRVEPRIGTRSPRGSQDFALDREGNLWMASLQGLWFHDVHTGESRLLTPGVTRRYPVEHPEIIKVFFDSNDNLWVGTRDGPARYDSQNDTFVRFEFRFDDSSSVAGSSIGEIEEDHRGDLWFGAWLGGGLSRFSVDEETFENWPNFRSSFPVELFAEIDGRIDQAVAGFRSVESNRQLRDTLRVAQRQSYLVVATYESLQGDSDDVGWIETSSAEVIWDVTTAECAHAGGAIKNFLCVGLLTLDPGDYYVRYDSDPVHAFDNWSAMPPPQPTWWGINVLPAVASDFDRIRPLMGRRERRPHTIPGNTLDIARFKSEVWVATGFNLMRRRAGARDFEFVEIGEEAGYVVDVEFDESNAFVLSQEPDSILVLDAESARFKYGISLGGVKFTDLLVSRAGDIWLASPTEGVYVVRRGPGPFQFVDGPSCLPKCPIELEATDGSVWTATDSGVRRTIGGTSVEYTENPLDARALRGREVSDIVEAPDGSIWIATADLNWDGGVNKFTGSDFDVFRYDPSDEDGLSSERPTDLLIASDGRMWVSHWGGVDGMRSNGTIFVRSTSPRRNVITHLVEDMDGLLWMADDGGGLMSMHPDTTLMDVVSDGSDIFWRRTTALAADPESGVWRAVRGIGLQYVSADGRKRLFGLDDGIGNLDFVERPLPEVSPEHLRFATDEGWLEVAVQSSDGIGPPDLYIVDRTVDEIPMSGGAEWVFPPGSGIATFRLTSPDYFSANTLEYRIPRLSEEWVETRASEINRLTGLAPGRYELEGRSVDARTGRVLSSVAISIHAREVLWRRTWFVALMSVSTIGIVLLVGGYLRRNALEITRTRQRIASDLHDDVGSKVAGIKIMAEMAGNSPAIENDARYELERIGTTAAEVIDALKEIVWFTDPDPKTDQHLPGRMRHVAERQLVGMNVDFRADPDALTSISLAAKRELMLIFREAVRNVADHSGARNVDIQLARRTDGIRLAIEDDGCGIAEGEEDNGFGLLSIRRRAKRIGGKLTIESSPGTGTRICLIIPE